MRMCRCAGRVRLRGRLRAGVAVAASAVSRQEIETCLVKRARRSIHASFWLFHQPARNASISDAVARGDGVNERCDCCQRCSLWLSPYRVSERPVKRRNGCKTDAIYK